MSKRPKKITMLPSVGEPRAEFINTGFLKFFLSCIEKSQKAKNLETEKPYSKKITYSKKSRSI